jgi:hypothetical protein
MKQQNRGPGHYLNIQINLMLVDTVTQWSRKLLRTTHPFANHPPEAQSGLFVWEDIPFVFSFDNPTWKRRNTLCIIIFTAIHENRFHCSYICPLFHIKGFIQFVPSTYTRYQNSAFFTFRHFNFVLLYYFSLTKVGYLILHVI